MYSVFFIVLDVQGSDITAAFSIAIILTAYFCVSQPARVVSKVKLLQHVLRFTILSTCICAGGSACLIMEQRSSQ